MTYADRIAVSANVPLVEVSHCITPVDLAWRLILLSSAIGSALFPAVAASHHRMPECVRTLVHIGSLAIIVLVFPLCTAIIGGRVFFRASRLSATTLDAMGRPEIGAIFLLCRSVLFPPAVLLATHAFRIERSSRRVDLAFGSQMHRTVPCLRATESRAAFHGYGRNHRDPGWNRHCACCGCLSPAPQV